MQFMGSVQQAITRKGVSLFVIYKSPSDHTEDTENVNFSDITNGRGF